MSFFKFFQNNDTLSDIPSSVEPKETDYTVTYWVGMGKERKIFTQSVQAPANCQEIATLRFKAMKIAYDYIDKVEQA